MSRYKFFISAYYAKSNNYLAIDEYEKDLFQVDGKTVKLLSLEKGKKISESRGVKIECGIFTNVDECVKIAKKVYINFLIRLNNTDISYILDKASMGNFTQYCKEQDAELYKEIIIQDMEKVDKRLYGIIESAGCGCTHFYFNRLIDMSLDQKLKDSLRVNNYRKYLLSNNIHLPIDNTLFSSSIEMLLDKEERTQEELDIINEVSNYLDEKFKETNNEAYNSIKTMIQNNKHKSINKKIEDLVKKYSTIENEKENITKIKGISKNRTKELHVSSKNKPETVFSWSLLNKIQTEYAKDLYKINP
ncbi:MAG: hypothetical protein E7313_03810 [Clostridiales bacterium]|nr:hypothetical protein [Clostridiales bacterium]